MEKFAIHVFKNIINLLQDHKSGLEEVCEYDNNFEKWLVVETLMSLSKSQNHEKIKKTISGSDASYFLIETKPEGNRTRKHCDLYFGPIAEKDNEEYGKKTGYWFEFKIVRETDFVDGLNALINDIKKLKNDFKIQPKHAYLIVLWKWNKWEDEDYKPRYSSINEMLKKACNKPKLKHYMKTCIYSLIHKWPSCSLGISIGHI